MHPKADNRLLLLLKTQNAKLKTVLTKKNWTERAA
jgi:hypothetical protein